MFYLFSGLCPTCNLVECSVALECVDQIIAENFETCTMVKCEGTLCYIVLEFNSSY